jgi:hypothetical protein
MPVGRALRGPRAFARPVGGPAIGIARLARHAGRGAARETRYANPLDLRTLVNENDQADRAISTGKLHALLHFHTQPIDVVVFHGSDREYWF